MVKSSDGIVTLVDLFCGVLSVYMQYTDVAKHLYTTTTTTDSSRNSV